MLKPTKSNLKKLETCFKELNYSVRYEKGNFNSGYCLVKDRKNIIINKFLDLDTRMSILLDIFKEIELEDLNVLSDQSQAVYKKIIK